MDAASPPITDEIFRLAFDSAATGMAVLSLEGRVQRSNPSLQRMLGSNAEALLGQPLVSLFHPQDQLSCTYALERALRERDDLPAGSLRYRRGEDGYRWARYQLRLVLDEQAMPRFFLARLESILEEHERIEQIYLLAFALDFAEDGIVLLDDELRTRYANDSACGLLGDNRQALVGRPIAQLIGPWQNLAPARLQQLLDDGNDLPLEIEHPADGQRIPLSIHVDTFRYDQRGYTLLLMRNLSEQLRMQQALLDNERQFRALIENTPDAIGRLTPDFHLIYANPALESLCRLPLQEARGRSAREFFGENAEVELMAELVRQVAQSAAPLEEEVIYGSGARQSHMLVKLLPEFDDQGRVASVVSLGRDISGLRSAERELEESNHQLRELTSRRESAREEERKLIAQEIHDELGQQLTALRMGISLLRLEYGEKNPGLGEQVEHLMGLCDRTIGTVRSIATSLRPSALNMGLKAALEWLVADFSRNTGINCTLESHYSGAGLKESAITALFRIVQEALTNVARHSGAQRVVVTLEREDDQCVVDISDNGRGFDPARVDQRSLGLAGMRERGLSQAGRVVIFSHPDQGTTVQASFPLNEGMTR